MHTTGSLLLSLSLALAGCGDPDAATGDAAEAGELGAAATSATPVNVAGTYHHTLTIDGLRRETMVYVPASAAGARQVPVVFMLHGTSGDGEKFYRISGWREKADAEGFIAVFPTALVHCFHEDENRDGDFDDPGELKVTTKWAAGKLGDPARMPLCTPEELARLSPEKRAAADHPLADDLAFARAMLDRMPGHYAVDPRRLYASGFSNGAAMTSRFALELSDRFAAVASASGSLSLDPVPTARPIPIILSYGELDEKILEPLGLPALPLDESVLDIPAVQSIVADYLVLSSLSPAYTFTTRTIGGARTSHFLYAESLVGARNPFELMVIEGLGHQYPNGVNHPVVMADLLWARFARISLP